MYIFLKKEDKHMIKSKSKFPITVIFFALGLFGCTFARFLQYSEVILPESGFFEHDGGFLNHIYYIVFGVSAALILASTLIDMKLKRGIRIGKRLVEKTVRLRETPVKPEKAKKAQKAANIRILPTVGAIIGAVITGACGYLLMINAFYAVQGTIQSGDPSILQSATLCMAALGYTFTAYSVFAAKKIVPAISLAFLFIAACYVSMAALEFMARTYIANLSGHLILLSTNLLLAMFFLNCGRIIVQTATKFTAVCATVFGYSAVILALSESIARFWYYYSADGSHKAVLDYYGFELPSVLFMVQAAGVLWVIYALSAKRSTIEREEAEESQEASENPENEENQENEELSYESYENESDEVEIIDDTDSVSDSAV